MALTVSLPTQVCIKRAPNRFFGMRDLASFKAGIRDLGWKRQRDSEPYTGIGNFTSQDSGIERKEPRSNKAGD